MKKLSKIGIFVLLLSLAFTSCKKVEEQQPVKPDGKALKNSFKEKLSDKVEMFSVNVQGSIVWEEELTTAEGIIFTIKGNSLKDKLGNLITGEVEIEVIEIFSKADMVLTNMPTMGKMDDGNHSMLISGGEFRLSASQNGEPLAVNSPIMMKVPVDNTGGADADMKLFDIRKNGDFDTDGFEGGFALSVDNDVCCDEDCDGDIICENDVWEEKDNATPAVGLFIEDFASVTYYVGFVDNFGWTNVDKFSSYTGEKTTLKVKAPEGFDNTNIAIYISYVGEASGLATLDAYLEDEGVFSEHYGQIPIGQEINVIAVSIVDGEYRAAIKPATIEEADDNTTSVINMPDLEPYTEAALIADINALP